MHLKTNTKKHSTLPVGSNRKRRLFIGVGILLMLLTYLMVSPEKPVSSPLADALYHQADQPLEVRVEDLLSRMTLQEKIGQMALVEKNSLIDEADIAEYGLGALLSGSGAKPKENTATGWKEMVRTYQVQASASRLGIPLLYGVDAVHGHAHVPGATVFPHSIGLGATHDAMLVEQIGQATAEELAATGIYWNYGPNLDLPRDIRWGRVYETFSDDTALAAELGAAYVRGLQASESGANIGALATLKHYVGLGSMGWGTSLNKDFKIDQGVTAADDEQFKNVYLPPFTAGVEAGALSVMTGLNQWGSHPVVTDKQLLTGVLKEQLGFKGFVVSDWYGIYEGRQSRFIATVQAVNAGMDMVMLPFDYKTFVRHMTWANRLGLIRDKRIDDAVRRILRAKFELGLFDNPTKEAQLSVIGSTEHRTLAREAVAKSAVLLKNEGGVLPVRASARRIYVAGSAADNTGLQSGAWTIEWQGIDGDIPGATSILAGIKEQAPTATEVIFNEEGDFNEGSIADVGIVVVGERPYAEGWGDRDLPILEEADRLAIERLRKVSKQLVVVVVSGRPLLIEHELGMMDALVAVWLPGSAGAGVADVLFGEQPFTGTLPLPWPLRVEQLPFTGSGRGIDGTEPLFVRGFGLK